MTYTATAFYPNSYIFRNGIKVCDDYADCGHSHRTSDAAGTCIRKLASYAANVELRDGNGFPIANEYEVPRELADAAERVTE